MVQSCLEVRVVRKRVSKALNWYVICSACTLVQLQGVGILDYSMFRRRDDPRLIEYILNPGMKKYFAFWDRKGTLRIFFE